MASVDRIDTQIDPVTPLITKLREKSRWCGDGMPKMSRLLMQAAAEIERLTAIIESTGMPPAAAERISVADRPPLTARQEHVLSEIASYQRQHGYPPSVRDLMKPLGIRSPNGIMCHLNTLAAKGYIRRDINRSRSIVLIP